MAERQVPQQLIIDRRLNRLLRKRSHRKKLVLEFGELKLEMNARHGLFCS